jgi:hypothetical protein
MLMRLGKILTVTALVTTLGAHWLLLQTVAWTGMLADNLCTKSLTEAVSDTFDGHHPCPLCRAIAAGKKSEKKNEIVTASQKFEFPLAAENITLTAPPAAQPAPALSSIPKSCLQKPPVPPPRSSFV